MNAAIPAALRFWPKVAKSEGCWIWTASLNSKGYGLISVDGRLQLAHRVSYTWAKGPIATGLQVDHRCFRRACVNPDHLEAVTARVNTLRSRKAFATDEHCARGHEWTARTLSMSGGKRRCLECRREDRQRELDRWLADRPVAEEEPKSRAKARAA
jgi:hypothetical protein